MALGGIEGFSPQKMQAARVRARVAPDMVAVACKVSAGTVRNWEAGRLVPTAEKAARLARVLNVDVSDLTTTAKDRPTLVQLRQWRGMTGDTAAELAGIGRGPLYTAERYVSPIPDHIRTAIAKAYDVSEHEIDKAWKRGRRQKFGNLGED